eukprot:scaffold92641_cov63-Phaeocystis_antarctica.AAC.1
MAGLLDAALGAREDIADELAVHCRVVREVHRRHRVALALPRLRLQLQLRLRLRLRDRARVGPVRVKASSREIGLPSHPGCRQRDGGRGGRGG